MWTLTVSVEPGNGLACTPEIRFGTFEVFRTTVERQVHTQAMRIEWVPEEASGAHCLIWIVRIDAGNELLRVLAAVCRQMVGIQIGAMCGPTASFEGEAAIGLAGHRVEFRFSGKNRNGDLAAGESLYKAAEAAALQFIHEFARALSEKRSRD